MKIHLNEKEVDTYGYYLEGLSKTIDEADYFNDILHSGEKVKERKRPYPIKELSYEEYSKNPYYQIVRPHSKKEGDVYLNSHFYEPNQGFVYDEISCDEKYFEERTPFGFFAKRFPFLALDENNTTWMSVTPHEINTMEKPIAEAHGHVITLGLGLGYYAFMVSNKDNVSKVSIVEMNPKIIDIFKKEILPFFPHPEKIEIIEGDAYSFLDSSFEGDYLFADLWHMPEDGLPMYTKMLPFEEKHPSTHFAYWIEKSMLALIRRAIMILIDEEMLESVDENYLRESSFSDHLINQIHFILKDKEISSLEEIRELLSYPSLKEIAKKIVF